jgi:hypothetical protein
VRLSRGLARDERHIHLRDLDRDRVAKAPSPRLTFRSDARVGIVRAMLRSLVALLALSAAGCGVSNYLGRLPHNTQPVVGVMGSVALPSGPVTIAARVTHDYHVSSDEYVDRATLTRLDDSQVCVNLEMRSIGVPDPLPSYMGYLRADGHVLEGATIELTSQATVAMAGEALVVVERERVCTERQGRTCLRHGEQDDRSFEPRQLDVLVQQGTACFANGGLVTPSTQVLQVFFMPREVDGLGVGFGWEFEGGGGPIVRRDEPRVASEPTREPRISSVDGRAWPEVVAALEADVGAQGTSVPICVHAGADTACLPCGQYTLALDASGTRAFTVGSCDATSGATTLTLTDRSSLFDHTHAVPAPRAIELRASIVSLVTESGGAATTGGSSLGCAASIRPFLRDLEHGTVVYLGPADYDVRVAHAAIAVAAQGDGWMLTSQERIEADVDYAVIERSSGNQVLTGRATMVCASETTTGGATTSSPARAPAPATPSVTFFDASGAAAGTFTHDGEATVVSVAGDTRHGTNTLRNTTCGGASTPDDHYRLVLTGPAFVQVDVSARFRCSLYVVDPHGGPPPCVAADEHARACHLAERLLPGEYDVYVDGADDHEEGHYELQVHAGTPPPPWVWRVTGSSIEPGVQIRIVGHAPFAPLDQPLDTLAGQTGTLITDYPSDAELIAAGILGHGPESSPQSISARLGGHYVRDFQHTTAGATISASVFREIEPPLALLRVVRAFSAAAAHDAGGDEEALARALAASLFTPMEVRDALESIADDDALDLIREIVGHHDRTQAALTAIRAAYDLQDEGTFTAAMSTPFGDAAHRLSMAMSNADRVARLRAAFANGSHTFALDLTVLLGHDGVLAALTSAGYRLERIRPDP